MTDAVGNPLDRRQAPGRSRTESQSPGVGPGGPIQVDRRPGRPVRPLLRGDPARRGPQRVRRDRRAGHRAEARRPRVVMLAPAAVSDAEVALLTDWVQGGGNLIAMRPDKKLAGLLGLTDAGGTRANQYLKVDPGSAVGRRDRGRRRCSSTAPRTATRSTAPRAIARLYSDAATATSDAGGLAARRGHRRRPGRGLRLRPGALGGLHAPGQPGLGGPEARRHAQRHPRRTTSSTAPRPATSSPTGWT